MYQEFIVSTITAIVGAIIGWFSRRKQEHQEILGKQLDNANELLRYYQNLCDDLGKRLVNAIAELEKTNDELRLAKDELKQTKLQLIDLEKKVVSLTTELSKYKQLNIKKP